MQIASAQSSNKTPGALSVCVVVAALLGGLWFTLLNPAGSAAAQPALMAFSENNGFEQLLVESGEVVPLSPESILRESMVFSNIAVDDSGESPTYYLLGVGTRRGELTADALNQPATPTPFDDTKSKNSVVDSRSVTDRSVVYLQSWQHGARVDLVEVEDNGLLGNACVSMHFDQASQRLVLWSWLPPGVPIAASGEHTAVGQGSVVGEYIGTVAHIDPAGNFSVVFQSELIAPPGAGEIGSMRACHSRWNPKTAVLAVMAQTPDQLAVRQIDFLIQPNVAVTCDRTYPHQVGVLTGEEQISSDNTGRLFWIPTAINTSEARGVYSFAPNACEESTPPQRIASLPVEFQRKFGRCQTVIVNEEERLLAVVIGAKQSTAAHLLTLDLDSGRVVNSPPVNLPDAQALGNCVAVQ